MLAERSTCRAVVRPVACYHAVVGGLRLFLAGMVVARRRVVGDSGFRHTHDSRRSHVDSRRVVREDATDHVQLSTRAISEDSELAVAPGNAVSQSGLDVAA